MMMSCHLYKRRYLLTILCSCLLLATAQVKAANTSQDETRAKVTQAVALYPKDVGGAYNILRSLGTSAIPYILEAIKDDSDHSPLGTLKKARTNPFLVSIIANMEGEKADVALIELLTSDDAIVRGAAAVSLGERKTEVAIPHLVKLLDDNNPYLYYRDNHPSGSDSLAADKPVLVKDVASKALRNITGTSQSSYRTIIILAEIDGKPVNSEKLKVELSVDKKPIFPQITGDELSLSLPDWVDKNKQDVVLKINYKRYELEFSGLSKGHLQGQWKIFITTSPRLDPSEVPNAKNVDYAYGIEFQSRNSLGTVWSSLKYRDSPSTSSNAFARTHQADEPLTKKWVLEQPTSPVKITLSANGEDYNVENHSARRVSGYQLGCAVEEAGKVRIKRRARPKQVDLLPLDENQSRRYGKSYTVYADSDFYPCVERKTKIAVLEVRFSDGSKWRINNATADQQRPVSYIRYKP